MSYKIIRYDESVAEMLPHKQEPFDIIGRLVPIYNGKEWVTYEEFLDVPYTKTYRDDVYKTDKYIDNFDGAAFVAIFDGKCVGCLRISRRWNNNALVDDLLVDADHRGHGVGTMLMDAAVQWSRENEYHGVSLETQDYNLLACRFYIKYGFKLGGIDRHVNDAFDASRYETALYFYLLPDNK